MIEISLPIALAFSKAWLKQIKSTQSKQMHYIFKEAGWSKNYPLNLVIIFKYGLFIKRVTSGIL